MQLRLSLQSSRSTYTSIITCRRGNGAAVLTMVIPGLETQTSTLTIGFAVCSTWPITYVPPPYPFNPGLKSAQSKKWSNMISLGLRNELRKPTTTGSSLPYTWATWYTQVVAAANTVNAANPDILIFLSGLDYDTKLTPIPSAEDLGNGQTFFLTDFKYANKLVLELHNYQNSATACSSIESGLWNAGFRATWPTVVNRMPVVLTEFGFSQSDSSYNGVYATCLKKLMPQWKTGWIVWVISGSYYIRSDTQDYEESWGLLNHGWSDWRNTDAIAALEEMVDATFAAVQ